jgi:hypothetical protein
MRDLRVKKKALERCWWLVPLILATWKAEIGRTVVWGQPQQIV